MALGQYVSLKKGDKGDAVRRLQWDLEQLGFRFPKYGKDGNFGTETEDAVKDFQFTYGLQVTGIVDQATANAIKNALVSEHAYRPPRSHKTGQPIDKISIPVVPKQPVPTLPVQPTGLQQQTFWDQIISKIDLKWIGMGILAAFILFQVIRREKE